MAEQRYQAVLAVIKDGRTVTEVAAAVGVSRQTLHTWLSRYEAGGLEGLVDGSHRPAGHPRQMSSQVEVAVLEARRRHPSWGPQRIAVEHPGRVLSLTLMSTSPAGRGGPEHADLPPMSDELRAVFEEDAPSEPD